jgi:hypothetical protein
VSNYCSDSSELDMEEELEALEQLQLGEGDEDEDNEAANGHWFDDRTYLNCRRRLSECLEEEEDEENAASEPLSTNGGGSSSASGGGASSGGPKRHHSAEEGGATRLKATPRRHHSSGGSAESIPPCSSPMHMDKRYVDLSLVELRSLASSCSTLDSSDDIWVMRSGDSRVSTKFSSIF